MDLQKAMASGGFNVSLPLGRQNLPPDGISKSPSLQASKTNEENIIFYFSSNPDTWGQFHQYLRAAFTRADPKNAIKLLNLTVFLRFWDLHA